MFLRTILSHVLALTSPGFAAMWLAGPAARRKGGGLSASPARRWSGKPRGFALFAVSMCVALPAWSDDLDVTFHRAKLAEIDTTIERAIGEKKCPGGVLWIERQGVVYHRAYGARAVEPMRVAMTEDTVFDAASLTKVVATTPAIMLLIERGQVELDAPVSRYWPEFAANGKAAITIRHLMTHTSGLRPGLGERARGETRRWRKFARKNR